MKGLGTTPFRWFENKIVPIFHHCYCPSLEICFLLQKSEALTIKLIILLQSTVSTVFTLLFPLLFYSRLSSNPASPVIPHARLQRLIVICIIIAVVLITVTVAPSLAVKIQINI